MKKRLSILIYLLIAWPVVLFIYLPIASLFSIIFMAVGYVRTGKDYSGYIIKVMDNKIINFILLNESF